METAKVIAICNHKGGVGKTVTTNCLGICLAQEGKKVLMIDFDPQGNLTKGLGFRDKSLYQYTIKDAMFDELNDTHRPYHEYITQVTENAFLIPANISFAGLDLQLAGMMSRETVLKRVLEQFKQEFDYILIDSTPTMSLYTINTLAAADSLIIPVQAEPYATDGLEDLMRTIRTAKKQLNPNLKIEGILLTMTDARTNLSKHISNQINQVFGQSVRVYKTEIPRSTKTAEASLYDKSPVIYAPKSTTAQAYQNFAKEVIDNGETITKSKYQQPIR
ncbi:MAG: ParA family protein [Candidatus Fimenecus sp.]